MKGLVLPGAMLLLLMVGCARQPSPDAADIAANNRGVGLMGQYSYADARVVFEDRAGLDVASVLLRQRGKPIGVLIGHRNRQPVA